MKKKLEAKAEERLTSWMEILKELNRVSADIFSAVRALDHKKRLAQSATKALDDFKRHVAELKSSFNMEIDMNVHNAGYSASFDAKFNESLLNPEEKKLYDDFMAKVAVADAEASSASEQLENLKNKKNVLLTDFSEFGDPLNEILHFQNKIDIAGEKVTFIQDAISAQQSILKNNITDFPSISALLQKRQDILAEIATGSAMEPNLKELDKQIEAERQKVSKAKKISDVVSENSQHTIAGLQRKLSTAQAELKTLADQRKEAKISFLIFEAEKVGTEYLLLAGELIGRYRQLIALDTILIKEGGGHIAGNHIDNFIIPSFDVQAHNDDRNKEWIYDDVRILSLIHEKGLYDSDLQAEKDRIADMGITI